MQKEEFIKIGVIKDFSDFMITKNYSNNTNFLEYDIS